jgi:ribosome-associated toxin RatA of RatAB toxin-antitoxin module|tara:strand:- start:3839 stop:4270 length:432 start_codon:yes stop_codon:yes gene_type:complete
VTRINKKAVVKYSANQMYALVNNIEAYPDFLPWCTGASITSRDSDTLIAVVSISISRIKKVFITQNTMQQDSSISMKLIKGPFKKLNGEWKFQNNSEGGSIVSLNMEFEFKNKLLKYAFGSAFVVITDSLVDAFVERAKIIYK